MIRIVSYDLSASSRSTCFSPTFSFTFCTLLMFQSSFMSIISSCLSSFFVCRLSSPSPILFFVTFLRSAVFRPHNDEQERKAGFCLRPASPRRVVYSAGILSSPLQFSSTIVFSAALYFLCHVDCAVEPLCPGRSSVVFSGRVALLWGVHRITIIFPCAAFFIFPPGSLWSTFFFLWCCNHPFPVFAFFTSWVCLLFSLSGRPSCVTLSLFSCWPPFCRVFHPPPCVLCGCVLPCSVSVSCHMSANMFLPGPHMGLGSLSDWSICRILFLRSCSPRGKS